jgi:CheY-like chemotaxis protein
LTAVSAVSGTATKARRPNILVIDDDQLLAEALSRSLRDTYEVEFETAASDACQRLAIGERFSAVLIDIGMPGMNGMDLYAWMSGACPEQAERVLFITGASPNGPHKRFLDRMQTRVLPKPLENQGLVTRIEALLSGG